MCIAIGASVRVSVCGGVVPVVRVWISDGSAQLLFVILWSSSALPMTEDDKRRLYVAPAMRKMRLTTVAAAATQSESYETCHFYALLTLSAVCCPCLHLSVAASVCPPAYHSLCLSISRPFVTWLRETPFHLDSAFYPIRQRLRGKTPGAVRPRHEAECGCSVKGGGKERGRDSDSIPIHCSVTEQFP